MCEFFQITITMLNFIEDYRDFDFDNILRQLRVEIIPTDEIHCSLVLNLLFNLCEKAD